MKTKNDLPDGFETRFWKLVLLLNLGPIALSVAVFLVVFRGTSRFVWASLGVSVAAFVFAARTYIVARKQLEDDHPG